MKNKAFTLIELLVVVAIIGILAAVGTFAYSQFTNYTKIVVTKNNHNEFLKFLKLQLSVCDIDGKIKLMSDANSLLVKEITCSNTSIGNLTLYIINHYQNSGFKNAFNNQEPAITGSGRPQSIGQTYLGIAGNPGPNIINGEWWISTKVSDNINENIWSQLIRIKQ